MTFIRAEPRASSVTRGWNNTNENNFFICDAMSGIVSSISTDWIEETKVPRLVSKRKFRIRPSTFWKLHEEQNKLRRINMAEIMHKKRIKVCKDTQLSINSSINQIDQQHAFGLKIVFVVCYFFSELVKVSYHQTYIVMSWNSANGFRGELNLKFDMTRQFLKKRLAANFFIPKYLLF